MRILILSTLSVSVGFLAACDNSAQSGTLIGAGGGALAGQAIGHNTESTLIGAGVGARRRRRTPGVAAHGARTRASVVEGPASEANTRAHRNGS